MIGVIGVSSRSLMLVLTAHTDTPDAVQRALDAGTGSGIPKRTNLVLSLFYNHGNQGKKSVVFTKRTKIPVLEYRFV